MDYNENNEQDVAKLIEILKHHKTEISKELEDEFGDFINFEQNANEDIFEDSDTDIETFDDNQQQEQSSNNCLTEYEVELINSCVDHELQQVLILNRSKNFKLIKLRAYIDNLLYDCDKTINQENINCGDDIKLSPPIKTPIWKLGAPYFKCSNYYCSPYNADVERKKYNKELLLNDLLYEPQPWTKLDCDNLLNGVLLNYNINKQTDIKRRICNLKRKITGDVDGKQNLSTVIQDLESDLDRLNNADANDTPPVLNSDEYIDWNKVADSFFQDKRTGDECRALWHIYLHPNINKKSWTKEENNKLNKLVKEYNYQNWEIISLKLESNRSQFTVALHYYRDIHDKYAHVKFTKNEDKLLLELIDLYRMANFIPWRKISEYFSNRSRQQLYHHYTYYLSKNDVKKGKFSDAEDILLLILVDQYGTDFRKCSEFIENRSQVQLKSRYRQNLENYKRKGTFTIDDDMEILKHVKHNGERSWGVLSKKLNRTRGTLRQRYLTIKQYLKTNANANIEDIPKRKHHELMKKHQHYEFVRYVADKFKNIENVPTLGMIEEFLENTNDDDDDDDGGGGNDGTTTTKETNRNNRNSRKTIDTMLINFFANSCKIKQQKYVKNFDRIANDINEILTILNVDLDIPTDYQNDHRLDHNDKIILNQLSIKNNLTINTNQLIPPNINTLIGLRSMLLKHKYLEKNQNEQNRILWEIERDLLNYNTDEQKRIINDRTLFTERFNKLHTWSSILSLAPPPNCIDDSDDDLEPIAKRRKLENIKTYSRRTEPKPSTSQCDL